MRPRTTLAAGLIAVAVLGAGAPLLLSDADAATGRVFTGIAVGAGGDGYLLSSARGEMYAFGGAKAVRNPVDFTGDIVDVALTADGQGALAVSSAGQFYAYGTARPQPNPTGFSGRIVAVAVTADGQGAMAVSSAGQFYAYGTARAQNNPVGFSGEIVDVALTSNGQGAMAVSSAGQFYAYGTARPQNNPSGFSGRIVGLDLTADGQGAMAISSTGQFYAYGTASAQPNPTGYSGEMAALDLTGDGRGVVAMSNTGQVYAYGTARHYGNGDSGCTNFAGTPVCFDIRARYQALGGPDGPLGSPASGEFNVVNGGRGQHFRTGSIYWSARTGAWDVRGLIRDKYFSMAAERSVLGMPTSGEVNSNGRYSSHFANGSILFSGPTGTHEVHGSINEVYARSGYEASSLGMPLTDERPAAGGTYTAVNFFEGGSIYFSPATGARKFSLGLHAWSLDEALTLINLPLSEFMNVQRSRQPRDDQDPFNWTNDSCSGYFLTPPEFDAVFNDACVRHDFQYRNFGRGLKLQRTAARKAAADKELLADAYDECRRKGAPRVKTGVGPLPIACKDAAKYMYDVVSRVNW